MFPDPLILLALSSFFTCRIIPRTRSRYERCRMRNTLYLYVWHVVALCLRSQMKRRLLGSRGTHAFRSRPSFTEFQGTVWQVTHMQRRQLRSAHTHTHAHTLTHTNVNMNVGGCKTKIHESLSCCFQRLHAQNCPCLPPSFSSHSPYMHTYMLYLSFLHTHTLSLTHTHTHTAKNCVWR